MYRVDESSSLTSLSDGAGMPFNTDEKIEGGGSFQAGQSQLKAIPNNLQSNLSAENPNDETSDL